MPLLGSAAENWPQFRGQGGRGISAVAAPLTWDVATGRNIAWTAAVPGLGHASPIVWGDRIYLATAVRPGGSAPVKIGVYGDGDSQKENDPHQWRLLCFARETGRLLWEKTVHEAIPRQERHTKATHCNSTPATDGNSLVAIFGSEGLFCFEMDGTLRWRRDLGKMDAGPWNAPNLQWSFAGSPVLHEGRVLVQCDVLSGQFVASFDARDGREVWRTAREEVANWCTPAVAQVAGRTQIVLNGWKQIGGYDFATGALVWSLSGGGDIPVPAPLVIDDWAYFTTAHGTYRPLRAVRLAVARGSITPPEIEATSEAIPWCHPKIGSYMQTPIVVGDLIWSCDWRGVLYCLERTTGKQLYDERLGRSGPAYTASGVAAGRHLYFASEPGQVYVVEAARQYVLAATNDLGAPVLATPAAVDGTLYFRTTEKLIAIRAR
ncbi:MAG: PQQ-binding-like beta-propeller repeat protein [Verrucomicrobia bacterium]|nr:PQQ-binding-like beta-propeller repeat protein [Verrucomicrobiota bacterium]